MKTTAICNCASAILLSSLITIFGSGQARAAAATTTTTLKASADGSIVTSVAAETVVTLTATVTSSAKPVTIGQVEFCDASSSHCTDIHLLGVAQLNPSGQAVLKLRPGHGAHSYKAVFLGTKAYASSSATDSVTVTGKIPTIAVASGAGAPGSYVVSALVGGASASSGPTGTVSFADASAAGRSVASAALGKSTGAPSWLALPDIAVGPGYLETNNSIMVAAGDFNGDGIPDLAVVSESAQTVTIFLGKGDGSYTQVAQQLATQLYPVSIAVGDFNNDGKTDIAVGNIFLPDNNSGLSIFLGNGNGTFTQAASPETGTVPIAIAVGDFNHDGNQDLAVVNEDSRNVTILLGNGDGTFTAASASPATGLYPMSIAVGDFNGDGNLDLAVANSSSDTVTVLLGTGNGTFTATASSPQTGGVPNGIVAADLNGDGKLDLAVSDNGYDTLTILLGDGKGNFTQGVTQEVSPRPLSLVAGDFSGDGKVDLAVAVTGDGSESGAASGGWIEVYLGKGDGTFTLNTTTAPAGNSPASLVMADINGDGVPDLIVANQYDGTLSQFETLAEHAATASVSVASLAAGPNLVYASYSGDSNYAASHSAEMTMYGSPITTATTLTLTASGKQVSTVATGTTVKLKASVSAGSSLLTAGQVAFCDAAAKKCTDSHLLGTAQLTAAGTASIELVPGAGSRSFKAVYQGVNGYGASTSPAVALSVGGKYPTATLLTPGGLPGAYSLTATVTGLVDQTTAPAVTGTVSFVDTTQDNQVLATASLASSASGMSWTSAPVLNAFLGTGIVVADFNGDGVPDFAVVLQSEIDQDNGQVDIMLGNGDGTYTSGGVVPVGVEPTAIVTGDFNHDGIPDLAVLNSGYGTENYLSTVTILLGAGNGTFTTASTINVGYKAESLCLEDFNGDGIPDLATTAWSDSNWLSGQITILLGNADGSFRPGETIETKNLGPTLLFAADLNGDGHIDLIDGSGGVFLGKGDGTFVSGTAVSLPYEFNNIAFSDINGDGKLDMILNTGAILLGKGDGTFKAGTAVTPAGFAETVTVGDFNGDGVPDLVFIGFNENNDVNGLVTYMLGKGDGTFTTAGTVLTEYYGLFAQMADLNGDGVPDLIFTNNAETTAVLTHWIRSASVTVDRITPPSAGEHLIDAIYSGDGHYASSTSQTEDLYRAPSASSISLALSAQGKTVSTVSLGTVVALAATVKNDSTPIAAGTVTFCDSPATACTADHLLGSVQLNASGTAVFRYAPAPGSHSFFAVFTETNTAGAAASSHVALTVPSYFATSTAIEAAGVVGNYTLTGTVTGIGGLVAPTGVVSFIDTSASNSVLATAELGSGVSAFNLTNASNPVEGPPPSAIAIGDFNGDGIPDIAVIDSNFYGALEVLLGNGDGTFQGAQWYPVGQYPNAIVAGDFNGDGNLDLAISVSGENRLAFFMGKGDGTFTAGASQKLTAAASALAVGDFNGDGNADLAVAFSPVIGTYPYPGTAIILLGNGQGSFTAVSQSLNTDLQPDVIAVADFNGDGIQDIAILNYGSDTVDIYLGNGDGTFHAGKELATGHEPCCMAAADVNGDGKTDLVVANYSDESSSTSDESHPTLSTFLSKGDGTFTTLSSTALDARPSSMAVADFNGDGKLDVALVGNVYPLYLWNGVMLLNGNGNGTFTLAGTWEAGPSPYLIAAADFNHDGIPDLVTTNENEIDDYDNSTAAVMLTKISQTTAAVVTGIAPIGTGAHAIAASYPGDSGHSGSVSGPVTLYPRPVATSTKLTISAKGLSDGSVPLGARVTLTASVSSSGEPVKAGQVLFCDASASSCTDIHLLGTAQLTSAGSAAMQLTPGSGAFRFKAVFTGTDSMAPSTSASENLSVTGKLASTTTITQSGYEGSYTLAATVSGLRGRSSPTGTVQFKNTSNQDKVIATAALVPGAPSFTFVSPASSATGSNPAPICSADFNGDGIPDLAVASGTGSGITILLGKGNGTFTSANTVNDSQAITGIVCGDFNGDGHADLAVSNSNANTVSIFLGSGKGTFTAGATPPTGNTPGAIVSADFNGDGFADLAVVNTKDNTVTILLGKGDGTFTVAPAPPTGSTPASIAVGDFNGDGIPDLAIANTGGSPAVSILLGRGDGTFTASSSSPSVTSASYLVAADFNGDGKADLAVLDAYHSYLTILLGAGNGTFKQAGATMAVPSPYAYAMAAADFNRDGIPDLVLAGSYVTILVGAGDGTFTGPMYSNTYVGNYQPSLAVVDLNGDSIPDIATAQGGSADVAVLLTQLAQNSVATVSGFSVGGNGEQMIDAVYSGDSAYNASTSGVTALAPSSAATPTVTVKPTVSAFEITQTDSIAVTVASAAGKPIPTGSIVLTLGTWASTATELTAGSVHIVIPANAVAAGSQTLTASYTPDWSSMGLYTGARSTAALTIEKASPSMALTASTTSLSYGTQLKLTATLRSAAASPDGSVTFTSGSTVLGTVKLGASGITTLQTNMLAVGTASIAAKYSGDSNNAAASSKAVSITTGKSKPAIALAPTANPAQAGASVTFTATLSGAGAKPTGSVVFFNGATQLGSVALNANGVAAFATSSLTAGSDTITASYSGNGDYTAVSASVTEAITK